MHDLAIITVSHNDARWLPACLSSVCAHLGDIDAEIVVVDNASQDDTAGLVRSQFPGVRVVEAENHGFGAGNNAGLRACDARYVLFLNPDTEILEGTFGELVRQLDACPEIGLAGARQITGAGTLDPTIRRFPSAQRALGEALGAERLPWESARLCERVLDPAAYERDTPCDWVSGSFMLVRREALEGAGVFDERFFMYSEETDLCRRIRSGGWQIRHLSAMTILHHEGKAGLDPRRESLSAYNRVVYARKHFSAPRREAYRAAAVLRHALRAVAPARSEHGRARRAANRRALATLVGLADVPFGTPATVAVRPSAPPRPGVAEPTPEPVELGSAGRR